MDVDVPEWVNTSVYHESDYGIKTVQRITKLLLLTITT